MYRSSSRSKRYEVLDESSETASNSDRSAPSNGLGVEMKRMIKDLFNQLPEEQRRFVTDESGELRFDNIPQKDLDDLSSAITNMQTQEKKGRSSSDPVTPATQLVQLNQRPSTRLTQREITINPATVTPATQPPHLIYTNADPFVVPPPAAIVPDPESSSSGREYIIFDILRAEPKSKNRNKAANTASPVPSTGNSDQVITVQPTEVPMNAIGLHRKMLEDQRSGLMKLVHRVSCMCTYNGTSGTDTSNFPPNDALRIAAMSPDPTFARSDPLTRTENI